MCQAYDNHVAVDNLSMRLAHGEIACLLGPSGCGKTSVLRTIAGFEPVLAGSIKLRDEVASRRGWTLVPERRRVGMVFQDYALFPHLTVAENIAFGLAGIARGQRAQRVRELLQLVHLADIASRYPHELSGGQQQRVALSRALAPRPELLLLDEPFSNLDVDLRARLGAEVRSILKSTDTTAILVTHDQHEAFGMADVIGVMNAGRIEQWDSAYNLYHRPASRFVADFIGEGVLLPGTMTGPHEIITEVGALRSAASLPCWDAGGRIAPLSVDVLVRPDDVVHDDRAPVRGEIVHMAFRGAEILYTLRLASGNRLLALVHSHDSRDVGESIGVRVDFDHLIAFLAGGARESGDGVVATQAARAGLATRHIAH